MARQSVEQHSRVVIVFVVFVVVANAMFENILHNQQKLWLINQLSGCSPKAAALKKTKKTRRSAQRRTPPTKAERRKPIKVESLQT